MSLAFGSIVYSAVKPIFKIYFIMGTGFLLAKLNILTVDVTRNLSDMIVMVILPCLTFNKIVGLILIDDLKAIGVICLLAALMYSFGALCGLITMTLTPVPKRWRGGCMAGAILCNASDLPIAYIQTLDTGLVFTQAEGNKGVAYLCIFLATFLFVQFNCGGFRLVEYDFKIKELDQEESYGDRLKKLRLWRKKGETADNAESDGIQEKFESRDSQVEDFSKEKPGQPDLRPSTLKESHESAPSPKVLIQEPQLEPTPAPETETLGSLSNISDRTSLLSSVDVRSENPVQAITSLRSPLGRESSRLTSLTTSSTEISGANLTLSSLRNLELRTLPSQNVRNVISEYAHVNNQPVMNRLTTLTRIMTTDLGATTSMDMHTAGKGVGFVDKYHLSPLVFVLQNFLRPVSVALVVALTIALIPWLKALFAPLTIAKNMPNAPDKLPPLSFIMDYTAYVGQALIPLGLLMLGTTLLRLDFSGMRRSFLFSAATLTVLKLCVMPMVGIAFASRLKEIGWLDNDMIFFVICITFSIPSATTQFYLTATYADPESEDTVQMDCLSVYLLMQYGLLAISLPFVVTFVLVKELGI